MSSPIAKSWCVLNRVPSSAREKSAAEYFARHAGEWDRLRALLAPADAVERALVSALGEQLGEVLDIGTGTGRIAELLFTEAESVSVTEITLAEQDD